MDREVLEQRYATASDDEIREAARAGKAAYRSEAWLLIQAEVTRRGLHAPVRRARMLQSWRGRYDPEPTPRGRLTPGLKVALLPAVAAVVGVVKVGLFGGRGTVAILTTVFFSVWFGIALVIDLLRTRRPR